MVPGDLGMIRDILMGPQMVKIEERFNSIFEKINALEAEVQEKIDQLNSKSNQLYSLEKEVDTQFTALEKRIETSVEKLEQMVLKVDNNSKQKLGKMLADVGQKLMESK